MAEQEITYIPYGQDEISQQDLMTNLANGLPDFVKSYKWLQKPGITEKFLNAYKDIINHGITGASNSSGLWEITHNGDKIDTSTMSPIDKQIYEHAAYYIQQQMSQMTTRKKAEDDAKKDLKDFNFVNDFNTSILNEYGGQQALFRDPEYGWNALDPRGANGLRGIDKRRNKVKTILQNYLNNYKDGQYNFEGTSFKDDADVRTKVQKAIDALDTIDNTTDDVEAFNALGLPYRTYFSNGGNESTDKINPATGTPYTYNEWNKYQQEQKELKAKQVQQNAYNNTLFLNRVTNPKMQGQNPAALKEKYKDSNSLFAALQNYSQRDIRTLTPDEQSEVHGAYRNLATESIDNNLLNRIKNSSSGFYKDSAPNRFRKIKGIDNLIWDSKLQQVIQLNNRQQQQALQNQPTDLFKGIQTLEEKQNTPISKEGWTSADSADVVSMIGDLVSLGGLWANIGGTATSLTADVYSDYTRGKDLGDILKGVGANLGWGLVGMLPGAKSTKVAARAARLVPKAFMLAQSAGIVLDPEVQKSALKFTNPSEYKNISSKDLENLKYLFHAVTGATNITKSHYRAKQYRETINKQKVQTKDGGTKNLSNKDVKEINKAGRKGGQKAAEEEFQKRVGKESAEGQFKFGESGKSKFNPVRYSSTLSRMFGDDQQLKGEKTTDLRALSDILKKDANRPWYNWNKGYPKFELTPFRHSSNYSNSEQSKTTNLSEAQHPKQKITAEEVIPNKEVRKAYRGLFKNEFSKNPIQSGDYTINGTNIKVVKQPDGSFNLLVKGEVIDNFNNQIHLQQAVRKIDVKEMGKLLRDLKRKGWLKQGGTINPSLDEIIEDFIKNNNI